MLTCPYEKQQLIRAATAPPLATFPSARKQRLVGNALHMKNGSRDFIHRTSLEMGLYFKTHFFHEPIHYVLGAKGLEHIFLRNHQNYVKGISYQSLTEMTGPRAILVSSGQQWKEDQKCINAVFQRLTNRSAEIMKRVVKKQAEQCMQERGTLDAKKFFFNVTYEIIMEVLFDFELSDELAEQAFEDVKRIGDYIIARTRFPHILLPGSLPLPFYRRARKASNRFDRLIYETIHERQSQGRFGESMLDALAQMSNFSVKEVRDQIVLFMVAGHETTAIALQHFWYAMGQHTDHARVVIDELRGLNGEIATNFSDLPHTRAMVYETLRLYPSIPMMARTSLEEDNVDGYHLPKKSLVGVPIYAIHRHPEIWDDPDAFRPERFLNRNDSELRYSFLPFGLGPRVCIGKRFSLQEMATVISMLFQDYSWKKVNPHPIRHSSGHMLAPQSDLTFQYEKT
ncbi:MAG: cytochrome P450 [Planctomycetota bacterium]